MSNVIVRWLRPGMHVTEWRCMGVPDVGDTVTLGNGFKWKVVHRHWVDKQIVEMTIQPDRGYTIVREDGDPESMVDECPHGYLIGQPCGVCGTGVAKEPPCCEPKPCGIELGDPERLRAKGDDWAEMRRGWGGV